VLGLANKEYMPLTKFDIDKMNAKQWIGGWKIEFKNANFPLSVVATKDKKLAFTFKTSDKTYKKKSSLSSFRAVPMNVESLILWFESEDEDS
jgi:hypothetical protein